jgi:hypothetical protein
MASWRCRRTTTFARGMDGLAALVRESLSTAFGSNEPISGVNEQIPGERYPSALNRCDALNSIRRTGHSHGRKLHTCQMGDRVRSVRGLSQLRCM